MQTLPYTSPDSKAIQSFFNSIPKHYDFLNSVLSLSIDGYWRRALVKLVLRSEGQSLLDIGVGTGKSLKSFLLSRKFDRAVGCDFSSGMLEVARGRYKEMSLAGADLHELPFANNAFELVTSSFVLRSVTDMDRFLNEVKRVMVPGAQLLFLDLTRPKNRLFWYLLYQPYLRFYIPLVGRLIARHAQAYQFLSQSIQTFLQPEALKSKMLEHGFEHIEIISLTGGAATILRGKKPLTS